MGRRKINKKQAIEAMLSANPNATTKEVAVLLKQQNVNVHPNYISAIKGNMKNGKGKHKAKITTRPKQQNTNDVQSVIQAIGTLKEIAKQLGGMQAVTDLAQVLNDEAAAA